MQLPAAFAEELLVPAAAKAELAGWVGAVWKMVPLLALQSNPAVTAEQKGGVDYSPPLANSLAILWVSVGQNRCKEAEM